MLSDQYHPKSTAMTITLHKPCFACSFIGLVFTLLSFHALKAQPIISLTPVINTGLNQPVQLVNAGDGTNRVFIVGKTGNIRVYDSSFNFLDTFLVIPGIRTDGEEGLLSLAFHPAYETNGFFYVYYTNAAGNLEIARYRVGTNPNEADTSTRVTVITIPHPGQSNHNGGEMHFGNDGYLYLSTGDGGGGGDVSNNAQTNTVLLGKIIRINVNTSLTPPYYTVPADNPYGNEVFASGLRNPFRWSFDRLTGDMWIGDVGQGSWEEINYRAAGSTNGANYGWRCYEGNTAYNSSGCAAQSNYVAPVFVYPNPGTAAVTGGVIYRGSRYPAMYGYYLATDFYSSNFYIINPANSFSTTVQAITPAVSNIADFGETENGELFVVVLTTGSVYRVNGLEGAPVPVTLVNFDARIINRQVQLQWKTSFEQNLRLFDIEFSSDGNQFTYAGTVQAQNRTAGAEYTFLHITSNTGSTAFYRLKAKDENGRVSYSGIIKVDIAGRGAYISPSVISNGLIQINLGGEQDFSAVEIISSGGTVVIKRDIESQSGRMQISCAELLPGIYIARFTGRNNGAWIQKIIIE